MYVLPMRNALWFTRRKTQRISSDKERKDGNIQKESMNGTWIYILNPVLITDNFVFKAEHTLFVVNVVHNK